MSSDLPASHYLRIYKIKLGNAEERATTSPKVLSFFRTLVANLAALDPSTPVRLTASEQELRFTNAQTGDELGRFQLGDV
jgi:hypothetical protein